MKYQIYYQLKRTGSVFDCFINACFPNSEIDFIWIEVGIDESRHSVTHDPNVVFSVDHQISWIDHFFVVLVDKSMVNGSDWLLRAVTSNRVGRNLIIE